MSGLDMATYAGMPKMTPDEIRAALAEAGAWRRRAATLGFMRVRKGDGQSGRLRREQHAQSTWSCSPPSPA
jgi:hypothetical protein